MSAHPIRTLADIAANRMQLHNNPNWITFQLPPDVDSIAALGTLQPVTWGADRRSCDDNAYFRHSRSYDEAVRLYRDGWPTGTQKAMAIVKDIMPRVTRGMRPVVKYRPAIAPMGGIIPNIVDIVNGGPAPFIGRFQSQQLIAGRPKTVSLGFNVSVSGGVDLDVIIARGAVVMATVMALRHAGIEPTITVFDCGREGATRLDTVCVVRQAGQPLNLDRLAFQLAHPSFLRRFMFAAVEHAAPQPELYYEGYGSPAPIDSADAKRHHVIVDSSSMIDEKGTLHVDWRNAESQLAAVRRMLGACGVKILSNSGQW